MAKKSNSRWALSLFFLIFCGQIEAQLTTSDHIVYRSRNPKIDPDYSYLQMKTVNLGNIYASPLNNDSEEGKKHQELLKGGIQANVGVGGEVYLKVYLYDADKPDGKGSFLYGCYTKDKICGFSNCGNEWREYGYNIEVEDPFDISRKVYIPETNVKANLQSVNWKGLECKESTSDNPPTPKAPNFNWGHLALAAAGGAELGCRSLAAFSPPMYKLPACAVGGAVVGAWVLGEYILIKSTLDSESLTVAERNCYLKNSELQSVIVELEVWNATVNKIKIPLMEEIDLTNQNPNYEYYSFFVQPPSELSVDIITNDDLSTKKTISSTDISIPVIYTQLGDELKFAINSNSPNTPHFTGLPAVWRANFAGEVLYYCSPSINPGELKPFLGFESQTDGVSIRRYPAEWKSNPELTREKDFTYIKNGDDTHTYQWKYTVNREMNPNTDSNYSPIVYKWPVGQSFDGGNTYQRYNQREGYNMELLGSSGITKSFLSNLIPNIDPIYLNSSTAPKYCFRFGADEILYIGSKFSDTKNHGFSINGGVFQVTSPTAPFSASISTKVLPWQQIWEDTNKTSVLNLMIDAYRLSKGKFSKNYDGYEIQDLGMGNRDGNGQIIVNPDGTIDFPEGTGIGNAKAPGLVTINLDGKKLQFKLETKAPFAQGKYKGFYSQITGTKYPSVGEQNVSYTLLGLDGLSADEKQKYYLQYDFENEYGGLKSEPARSLLYGGTNIENSNRSYDSDGNLVSKFNIEGNNEKERSGFHSITAYYKRCATCTPVPIAGKELLATGLRFVSVKLKNAPYAIEDDPMYAYQEEYNEREGMRKFSREFTFKVGDGVSIAINDDHHTLYKDGGDTEHSFSKRYHSNTIKSDQIKKEGLKTYLTKLGNQKGTPIGEEAIFDYTFLEPGNYDLECNYRGYDVHHLVHIVPAIGYGTLGDVTLQGKIESTMHFPEYGLASPNNADIKEFRDFSKGITSMSMPNDWENNNNFGRKYIMAQTRFIYSDYMYGRGAETENQLAGVFPRAYTDVKHKNKFAKYNDFAYTVKWYLERGSLKEQRDNDPYVKNFLDNYLTSTSSDLAYQNWYPDLWVRRYSDAGASEDPLRYFPEDMKTNSDGSLAYSLSQKKVENLMDEYFSNPNFVNTFEPWQKRLPRISWTKSDGPRVHINSKTIVSIQHFFDSSAGAFSGNPPELPQDYLSKINPEMMTKNQKKLRNWYYDLNSGEKIIFDLTKKADGSDYIDYYHVNRPVKNNLFAFVGGVGNQDNPDDPNNPWNPNQPNDNNPNHLMNWFIAQNTFLQVQPPEELGLPFLCGADLSSANQLDDCGAKFQDLKKTQGNNMVLEDIFELFAKHEHNLVSVRLWMNPTWTMGFNPTSPNSMYSDINDVKRTIRRAKEAGMKVLLAIEYSDAWVLDDTYNPPAQWANIASIGVLENEVRQYTKSVLEQLRDADGGNGLLIPDLVQIGGLIDRGLFYSESPLPLRVWNNSYLPSIGYQPPVLNANFPKANFNLADISEQNQIRKENMVRIIRGGINGVKDFRESFEENNIVNFLPIVLYLGTPERADIVLDAIYPILDNLGDNSFDYDIIGIGYPSTPIHSLIEDYNTFGNYFQSLLSGLRNKYFKNVMVVKAFGTATEFWDDTLANIYQDPLYVFVHRTGKKLLQDFVNFSDLIMDAGGIGLVALEPAGVSLRDDGPFRTLWGKGSVRENCTFFKFAAAMDLPSMEWNTTLYTYRANWGIDWPKYVDYNLSGGGIELDPQYYLDQREEFEGENIKPVITESPEKEKGMSVSPNPTNGRFTLQFEKLVHCIELQLINMNGKQVDYKKIDYKSNAFEVSLNVGISEGVYFLRARTDQGVYKIKIVIKK